MRIQILALKGVFDTGLAAVLDAFRMANALAQMTGIPSRFQPKVVGLRKSVTTARGLSVPVTAAARAPTPDVVVMPAIRQMKQ
jgi:transcriptional regulator GlxA family with amidase domain